MVKLWALRLSPFLQGLLAMAIGTAGGGILALLSLPLAWIFGSMMAAAAASLLLRLPIAIPSTWRDVAIVAVGVMLGSGFSLEVLADAARWWPSLLIMMTLSVLFFVLSYGMARRFTSLDRNSAVLSALPGGVALATSMSSALGADGKRVALAHSIRVVAILAAMPLVTAASGSGPQAFGTTAASTMAAAPLEYMLLAAVGLMAFVIGRRLRLPSGLLVAALVLSAVVHIAGWSHATTPAPIMALAQVVIGTGIGARFGDYSLRELLSDFWLSAVVSGVLITIAAGVAYVASDALGQSFASLLLSYVPGGAPEIGVLALSLDVDTAMVATHHLLRIVFLTFLVIIVTGNKRPNESR